MSMSHKCQGNLRAYIFLSPVSFIQDTLDYVRQPTTTINTIMSSKKKNGNLKQTRKQEHANTKGDQKRKRKRNFKNQKETQKTYLSCRKGVDNWERMENERKSLYIAPKRPRKRSKSRRSSRMRVESSQEWVRGNVLKG